MNKVAVYTSIFGSKDILWDPLNYKVDDSVDYYCYTDDRNIRSDIYKVILKDSVYPDVTKNARFYKVLASNDLARYDYVIWHDGNIQMHHNRVKDLLYYLKGNFIATFGHPHRDCVYDECIVCIQRNKDSPFKIFYQIFSYFRFGMPANFTVYETAILIRDNRTVQSDFFELWWNNILYFSRRDQISLSFVAWSKNISINILPGCRESNNFGTYKPHVYSSYKFKNGTMESPSNKLTKMFWTFCIKMLKLLHRF